MLDTLPDPPPAPPSPKPAADPFRTAVDLLKQGTRAHQAVRAGDTSKRVAAIALYRKGLVQGRDVIASGRFSDRVVEAMQHKAQQGATALTHLEAQLTPEQREELASRDDSAEMPAPPPARQPRFLFGKPPAGKPGGRTPPPPGPPPQQPSSPRRSDSVRTPGA